MANFSVGQKVVRVNSARTANPVSISARGHSYPKLGEVCTIKTINVWSHGTLLTFVEHDNSHLIGDDGFRLEPGFAARAFRPVVQRKTDISIFKKMLAPQDLKSVSRRAELIASKTDN